MLSSHQVLIIHRKVETGRMDIAKSCDLEKNDTKRDYSAFDEASITLNFGAYSRPDVTNAWPGQANFDHGLRFLLSYQHEEAFQYFLLCLENAPDCALAHALVAYTHGPNYNFRGEPYYEASFPRKNKVRDSDDDLQFSTSYPNQLVANYHARMAVEKVEELKKKSNRKKINRDGNKSPPTKILDGRYSKEVKEVEVMLINAIMILSSKPGIKPSLAEKACGYPFADAMREVYQRFPDDAEVAYFFAESLMVLHAWKLFEYPSARPLSEHVEEVKDVLESALTLHPQHVGLCHLYVHLCEMAPYPEKALPSCDELRTR